MHDPETPTGLEKVGAAGSNLYRRFGIALAIGGLLLAAGAGVFWFQFGGNSAPVSLDDDDDTDQALAVVNPGYVGIDACAECHDQRAASFRKSRHYLACRMANGAGAQGFTPGRGLSTTCIPGVKFEMSRTATTR